MKRLITLLHHNRAPCGAPRRSKLRGTNPEEIREAAFMALPLATKLLEQEKGISSAIQRHDAALKEAIKILKNSLPDVYT
jgi:hypothetical protein